MIKRLTVLCALILALTCAFLLSTNAQAASESDLTFKLNDDGESYCVSNCNESASGELVIPETYNEKPVTTIGELAFYGCENLTSITIPDSIDKIGEDAFLGCDNLSAVNIFDIASWCDIHFDYTILGTTTVYGIDCYANPLRFAKNLYLNGKKVTDLVIPDGVTGISSYAFIGANITSITVPNSVTSIGVGAFAACYDLTSITLPFVGLGGGDTVNTHLGSIFSYLYDYGDDAATVNKNSVPSSLTSVTITGTAPIRTGAFSNCAEITSITFSDKVNSIESGAFDGCTGLQSVHITDLNAWCNIAFQSSDSNPLYYAKNLYLNNTLVTELVLPSNITHVGSYAFSGCNSLSGVKISKSMTSIGSFAFAYCPNLVSVTIPESVTSIGSYAFSDCTRLTSITIPKSVTSIGSSAFSGCAGLTSVTISEGITSIESFAFSGCTKLTSITIPKSITSIGGGAFYGCSGLNAVNFNAISCTSMESYYPVFSGCSKLTNIIIGKSVAKIPEFAFTYCSSLTDITIPDSVTAIGQCAFYGTPLCSITLGKNLSTIGSAAFGECKELMRVYNRSNKVGLRYDTALNVHTWEGIASDNDLLKDAYWYYSSCVGTAEHTHTNACDTTCNTCGATRSITHNYAAATCTKAKTCKACGATSGSALGHKYSNNCDTSCNTCGAKRSITHNYAAATCTKAKTCKTCGATSGSALGHKHTNACDTTCNTCGATRKITHSYSAATCTKAKTCKTCGVTSGKALGHKYTNDCDTSCNVCGAKRSITHNYAAATCTKAKTCKTCGVTSGSALGHKYTNGCDTTCNTCGAKRTIKHTYKTTTTKATLKKNGSTVKKCTECGEVESKKTIKKIKSVKLSKTSYTYNGKAQKPSVTVKDSAGKTLKKGTDYTVTYASGRKNVGTYKVTIKFKGKYSGTKVLTFKINPPKTTIKKVASLNDALKVTVNKKTTQVTGYQVQYSTSKSFTKATTKTVKSAKTTSLTLKKLKSNKKYFVRVRTFKTVKGTKYYSGWSSYKTAKTK